MSKEILIDTRALRALVEKEVEHFDFCQGIINGFYFGNLHFTWYKRLDNPSNEGKYIASLDKANGKFVVFRYPTYFGKTNLNFGLVETWIWLNFLEKLLNTLTSLGYFTKAEILYPSIYDSGTLAFRIDGQTQDFDDKMVLTFNTQSRREKAEPKTRDLESLLSLY